MSVQLSAFSIPDLAGKAVLVTGGSTGIGAALVEAYASQKCRVGLHYNASAEAAAELAKDSATLARRSSLSRAIFQLPPRWSASWKRRPAILGAWTD